MKKEDLKRKISHDLRRETSGGFTLIEVLITMVVSAVSIAGLTMLMTTNGKENIKSEVRTDAATVASALLVDASAQVTDESVCGTGTVITTGNGVARKFKGNSYEERVVCKDISPGLFELTATVIDPKTGLKVLLVRSHTPRSQKHDKDDDLKVEVDDSHNDGWEVDYNHPDNSNLSSSDDEADHSRDSSDNDDDHVDPHNDDD